MRYGIAVLLLGFLAYCPIAVAQEYVYVNTDNLILRSRPEKTYTVFDILHAGSRVKVIPPTGYTDDKYARNFQCVLVTSQDYDGRTLNSYGWVDKRYIVDSKSKITVPVSDTAAELLHTIVPLESNTYYYGNPNRDNYLEFPYPKYKGGERTFAVQERRQYYTGPKGGCYYIKNGNRIYVDKKFCKGR